MFRNIPETPDSPGPRTHMNAICNPHLLWQSEKVHVPLPPPPAPQSSPLLPCCGQSVLLIDLVPAAQGHSGLEEGWCFTPFTIPPPSVPLFEHCLRLLMKVKFHESQSAGLKTQLVHGAGFQLRSGKNGRGKESCKNEYMKHMCPMGTWGQMCLVAHPSGCCGALQIQVAGSTWAPSILILCTHPCWVGAPEEQVRAGWHMRVLRTVKQSPKPHHDVHPGCNPQDISALAQLRSGDQVATSHKGPEATLWLGHSWGHRDCSSSNCLLTVWSW